MESFEEVEGHGTIEAHNAFEHQFLVVGFRVINIDFMDGYPEAQFLGFHTFDVGHASFRDVGRDDGIVGARPVSFREMVALPAMCDGPREPGFFNEPTLHNVLEG